MKSCYYPWAKRDALRCTLSPVCQLEVGTVMPTEAGQFLNNSSVITAKFSTLLCILLLSINLYYLCYFPHSIFTLRFFIHFLFVCYIRTAASELAASALTSLSANDVGIKCLAKKRYKHQSKCSGAASMGLDSG